MITKTNVKLFLIVIFVCLYSLNAYSESLTISIKEGKKTIEYRLFEGETAEQIWYYLPIKPSLFEFEENKIIYPDFQLLKYQRRNPDQPDQLIEGGVLAFSVQLKASEKTEKELLIKLRKRVKGELTLKPAPIKDVKVKLHNSENKEVLVEGGLTKGFASHLAQSRINLTVKLDKTTTSIYESLATSTTGIPLDVHWFFTSWGELKEEKNSIQSVSGSPLVVTRRVKVEEEFVSKGFISLHSYDQKIQENCILIDSGETWKNSWLILPFVGDDPTMGIDQVDIKMSLELPKKGIRGYGVQQFFWKANDQVWRENKSKKIYSIAGFELTELAEKLTDEQLKKMEIKVTNMIRFSWVNDKGRKITSRIKSFSMIPLFDGEIPIATPIEFIDLFSFNTASLSWAQISDAEDETKLESIRVKLVNGKLEFIAQIIPQKLGKNRWRLPEETLVLLSKERTKPITVEATYRFIDGTEKKWKNPYQMDFQKNLIIDFFDEDCSFE